MKLPLPKRKAEIETFSAVTLRVSGMRGSVEYEIIANDGGAEASLYQIRYGGAKAERQLEKRAAVRSEDVLRLLNACRLLSWDGFHGAHPRGVRDGTMFSLNAVVNGGKTIRADGSQRFPKHYRELLDGIVGLLG